MTVETADKMPVVYNRHHLVHQRTVLPFLYEALSSVTTNKRPIVEAVIDMGRIVGTPYCIETVEGDDIVYAVRANCSGYSRFVKGRKGFPTNKVTIVMKLMYGSYYQLHIAHIGDPVPYEPHDSKIFNTTAEYDEALAFWRTHALPWDNQIIKAGTVTDRCPW